MASMHATSLHQRDLVDNQPATPVQHQYGTRIRSNSVLRPSARLRQSPDPPSVPRRIKPAPSAASRIKSMPHDPPKPDMPVFPPPHVMLHPDDSTSKVFLAVGRCFLSVNNCAMTIKDLAEMTLEFGLSCQNVSAAGQAITTYIRTHMQRCDEQGDHPLLLRHPLSGTPSDDDLVEALHSRSGGAHCTISPSENRITNFRKGTVVWYLSRAAGAPCPFARAGIKLCEYTENGRIGDKKDAREKKKVRDQTRRPTQCGQKRKRLTRSCTDKRTSDSDTTSEEEKRPPKVKLTLRLKPRLVSSTGASSSSASTPAPQESRSPEVIDLSKDSDDDSDSSDSDSDSDSSDSMSIDDPEREEEEEEEEEATVEDREEEEPWSMPPYPITSTSIPGYTPSLDISYPDFSSPHSVHRMSSEYRRSPSVPYSVASPPPDSEDEIGDFHVSMARLSSLRRLSADNGDDDDDMEWDPEFDCDDTETDSRSPGPRSPSAPLILDERDGVIVKQEPNDVRGMLDAWENLDNAEKVVKVVTQAAAAEAALSFFEEDINGVKIEELDMWDWDTTYTWNPTSPGVDAVHVKEEEDEYGSMSFRPVEGQPVEHDDFACMSPLTPLSALSPGLSDEYASMSRSNEWKDAEILGPDSVHPREFEEDDWRLDEVVKKDVNQIVDATVKMRISPLPGEGEAGPHAGTDNRWSSRHPEETMAAPVVEREVESSSSRSPSLSSSVGTMSSPEPMKSPSVDILPESRQIGESLSSAVVVVRTCEPCVPAICATEVEGISVYQMTLGNNTLLRRIDTDFVNISPIVKYLGVTPPSSKTIPNAKDVTRGSPTVIGTWVALTSAQAFVREHPVSDDPLGIFLSDVLYERFPKALQDFHKSNTMRPLNHFGPHFRSTELRLHTRNLLKEISTGSSTQWDGDAVLGWEVEDHLMNIYPPYMLASTHPHPPLPDDILIVETPLTPSEQEMFHELCITDWENYSSVHDTPRKEWARRADDRQPLESLDDTTSATSNSDRPLRRSKRVANAIAARSRTRSSKRGSRGSLS